MPDEPSEVFARVRRELESLFAPDDTSREARLVRRAERKRRALRGHVQSFFVTNGFLFLLWLALGLTLGSWFPWFVFPLLGWGMGLTTHALRHRSWQSDHRVELEAARERLGLLPPPPQASRWDRLEARCRTAVGAARGALASSGSSLDLAPLLAQLEAGERQLAELLAGGRSIDDTLSRIAPGGVPSVDRALEAVERERRDLTSPAAAPLAQKRALLVARRDKIEALLAEQARIEATAEGFLLAAENAQLDAVRLGRSPKEQADLDAAIARLDDELEVLRAVHRELSDLS